MSYQQNNTSNAGQQATAKDLVETKRLAKEAVNRMVQLNQVSEITEDNDEWIEAATDLHTATMMYYNEIRPYIYESALMDDKANLKVHETEDGAFYITQLDDFRLASKISTEQESKPGEPEKQVEKKEPQQVPPATAIRCVDYLDRIFVRLGMSVDTENQEPRQQRNVSETQSDVSNINKGE
jgi:hypothetical protein